MLLKIISKFTSKEFLKFLLVGGFAAAVNFFSRIGLSYLVNFTIAVVIAYCIGMITAFILNKVLVFQASRNTVRQFLYFSLVNAVAIIQTVVISIFLAEWLFPKIEIIKFREEIAHFIGISIPMISSFLGHKYLSFKKA